MKTDMGNIPEKELLFYVPHSLTKTVSNVSTIILFNHIYDSYPSIV